MESVSDEWLRFRIVRGLGPTRDSNALRSLIRILRDDAETALVRGGAAETLPDFDDPTVIEPLIDSLEDSVPEVRFWSAYALSQIRDRLVLDALPALETIALHDETAVDGWWAVQDEAIAAIKKILYRHIDETLLASARRIMGRSGRRRGTERWLEALIDLDVKARREAARTLSEWKNPLTIQPLVVASLGDEDLFVRMYATFSLGMITTEKESVNALHETLANNEIHPWLRAQAADSLGEVGDPGVASDIVPLLNDPDPYIRYWILVALRKIGSESALPALKKRLSDFEEIPFYGVIADEAQHAISSITSVDKRDHRQVN
jgi:HEAT repeat protein